MLTKLIITIVYLAIVGYLGYLGYRHTHNTKDYLIGGRQIHPMVMALSYGATFISTSAIIGFGGVAGLFGMSLLWLTFLNIFLGIFIAFVFFGKRTRKMGRNLDAHTFPEFLGKRFESKLIQRIAGLIIFLFMPIYTAAVMIGAATFIKWSLGIDYNLALFLFAAIVAVYVFFGGLKGVMYSDAFQGSLMFIGMLILLISAYSGLGGFTAAHEKLSALIKNPMVVDQIKASKMFPPIFNGWTAMPDTFSINWWVVVSSIILGVGIGVLAQPQLAVRFMTVKGDRELNRAVPIGGLFILMMTGVAFVVGPLSNVYFFEKFEKIAVLYANGPNNVIPAFLNNFMPDWFVSVFLIVIVAAGMSTISSQFHAIGTAVGRDLFSSEGKSEKQMMLLSRIGMLVAIVLTIILAYVLPSVWSGSIAISTGLFFGICAAAFLPMYFGGLYFKGISKLAAKSGFFVGLGSSLLWMMFMHKKESSVLAICNLIFGKPSIASGKWAFVDPIVISLTLSTLVTLIVGLATKSKFSKEHIDKCFDGVK